MNSNICLTGIIINYHNNLPFVITLNKIFIYLLVIFRYSESSYIEYAIIQKSWHFQPLAYVLEVTPCASQPVTPLQQPMRRNLSPAAIR